MDLRSMFPKSVLQPFAHVPTPIHKWNLHNLPKNTQLWINRDDLSEMQVSDNEVRKLEFLWQHLWKEIQTYLGKLQSATLIYKIYVACWMGEEVLSPAAAASVLRFMGCSCSGDVRRAPT